MEARDSGEGRWFQAVTVRSLGAMHEDDVVEINVWQADAPVVLTVGIDRAKAQARADYLDGRVSIEEFETEIGRLLRKEAEQHAYR
jgi:hypothetical protein